MRQYILQALAAAVLLASAATPGMTHSDRGEKRPQTYAELFIPACTHEWNGEGS
ncbi:hypothetical protein [Ruegeria sp.]|uniref:hypothetical protein n=1 Tax=Ruegeria sp. TaxID=1879320 RepID=UPI003B002FEE